MIFSPWRSPEVSSFFYYQKHEDITLKTLQWDEEMKTLTVSSFSLHYTWRSDLRLYNHMILAILKIMFIYSGIVVIWNTWILICQPPVSFVSSTLCRAQMTLPGSKSKSAGLKWQQCPQNEHYFYIKMECFAKHKTHHLRCLTGFSIHFWFSVNLTLHNYQH